MFRKHVLVFSLLAVATFSLRAGGELSGRRAPGFSLPDSNMQWMDIQDFRGKVVVIDFMQTACPHCQTFSRVLEKLKAKFGEQVQILSIVNPPSQTRDVLQYIKENRVTTPILFDCGQAAASYLKVTPQKPSIDVPHVFVIDRNGRIVDDYGYGPQNKAIFEGQGLFPVVEKFLRSK